MTQLQKQAATFESGTARKWAVAGCVLVALVSRLSFLGDPFKEDAGIYVYLGKVLWQGGRLYHDFWETKLPSVSLLVAPLYGIFGNHWAGYVLLQAAMGVIAAFALAMGLRRAAGEWTFLPALFFGLIALNLSRIVMTGFQLETIQTFFESLCACAVLYSLVRRKLSVTFLAGFLAGMAAMPKPTGLAVLAAGACAYLWEDRGNLKTAAVRVGLLTLGAAVPIAIVIAWVVRSPLRSEMPLLLREISLYASGTPWRSLLQFKTWVFFTLPFLPLGIRVMICRLNRCDLSEQAPRSIAVFATVWMILEVMAVVLQKRLYGYHFLILMPPAVVLFALWPRDRRLWPVIVAVSPLVILTLFFSVSGYLGLGLNAGINPVSQYVASHTNPSESVWGDPAARLLLEADRPAGARLQMTFYMVNHNDAPQHFSQVLISDFDERRPKYVVLPVGWAKEMQQVVRDTPGLIYNPQRRAAYIKYHAEIWDYVQANYHLETKLAGKSVYRRNGS